MLIVVTGSREWNDWSKIRTAFDCVDAASTGPVTLIHGDARGADRMCGFVAERLGWTVERMPADWNKYGRSAGFRRNEAMLDRNPDLVLAFWDGQSRGTKHTIDTATERNLRVKIIQ